MVWNAATIVPHRVKPGETFLARLPKGRLEDGLDGSIPVGHLARGEDKTLAMRAATSEGSLVARLVGQVLTIPQCLEMEKPSTEIVGKRRHGNKGTKGCRNTVIITVVLHPVSELTHTGSPNVVFTVGSDRMNKTSMYPSLMFIVSIHVVACRAKLP